MIEVTIKDTKGNMSRVVSYSKEQILNDSTRRMVFVQETSRMIGGFLQDLKKQAKEDKT